MTHKLGEYVPMSVCIHVWGGLCECVSACVCVCVCVCAGVARECVYV